MRQPTRNRLDINALEARLACHRQTIWRWYTARDFPRPHYLGQKRLWWEDEVEAWENKQMAAHPSNAAETIDTDSFLTMSGSSPPDENNDEGGEK